TGFDKELQQSVPGLSAGLTTQTSTTGSMRSPAVGNVAAESTTGQGAPVIPFPGSRQPRPTPARPTFGGSEYRTPRTPNDSRTGQDLTDMEIPTFIRRQMD